MTRFHYQAFGLVFSSPWAIPSMEGASVSSSMDADVVIDEGVIDMPDGGVAVDEMTVLRAGEEIFLRIDDAAVFRISKAREILIHRDAGATLEIVQMFLLGTVFGTMLHDRSLLPLHSNALDIDGHAVLFCGDSGAGKSTTAAFFQARGYRILTDDVSAVTLGEAGATVRSGIPRLKLWRNSLKMLDREYEALKPVPWVEDKFELALSPGKVAALTPVAAIYHLRVAGEGRPHGIHRLSGLQAANSVLANVYRRRVADLIGCSGRYLAIATAVAWRVPVFSVNRTWDLGQFGPEAEAAETHMLKVIETQKSH